MLILISREAFANCLIIMIHYDHMLAVEMMPSVCSSCDISDAYGPTGPMGPMASSRYKLPKFQKIHFLLDLGALGYVRFEEQASVLTCWDFFLLAIIFLSLEEWRLQVGRLRMGDDKSSSTLPTRVHTEGTCEVIRLCCSAGYVENMIWFVMALTCLRRPPLGLRVKRMPKRSLRNSDALLPIQSRRMTRPGWVGSFPQTLGLTTSKLFYES